MACICSRTGVQTVFFWEGPQNKYFQIFGPSGLSGSYSALLAGNCRHLWTTWEQTDVAVSQWNLTYTVRLGTWTPSRITTGNLDFTLHCNNNFSAHRIIKCLGFHFCSLEHCLLCCTNLQYAAPKAALSPTVFCELRKRPCLHHILKECDLGFYFRGLSTCTQDVRPGSSFFPISGFCGARDVSERHWQDSEQMFQGSYDIFNHVSLTGKFTHTRHTRVQLLRSC